MSLTRNWMIERMISSILIGLAATRYQPLNHTQEIAYFYKRVNGKDDLGTVKMQ